MEDSEDSSTDLEILRKYSHLFSNFSPSSDSSESSVSETYFATKNQDKCSLKRRRPADEMETALVNALAATNARLEALLKSRTEEQDEIYHFAQLMARQLRALPRGPQTSLMDTIMRLTTEARLKALNDNNQSDCKSRRMLDHEASATTQAKKPRREDEVD